MFLLLQCSFYANAVEISEQNNTFTYLPNCEMIKVAQSHNKSNIQEAIDAGFELDCQNKFSKTALMIAAAQSLEALDVLLENGADTEIADGDGYTAIFYVLRNKNKAAALKRIVAAGADVNARSYYNDTVLSRASSGSGSESEKLEIAGLILEAGAIPDARDSYGRTVLMRNSQADGFLIGLLVHYGADINASDKQKQTVLMAAAYCGTVDSVSEILTCEPKINQTDVDGKNEILYAAANMDISVLDLLEKAGVKVDAVDNDGRNGLLDAACLRNIAVVKWFLQRGIDINSVDKQGRNAVALIVQGDDDQAWKYKDIVRELIILGVDINKSDINGFKPVELATDAGNNKMVKMLVEVGADLTTKTKQLKQSQLTALILSGADVGDIVGMLNKGYDANAEDDNGFTPFAAAAMAGAGSEIFLELLKRGVDINVSDSHGRTMLMFICYGDNSPELLKVFLENVKDIDKQDDSGVSALMIASLYQSSDIVKLLINAGANLNLKDSAGRTALFYAAGQGNLEVVEQLVNAGADTLIRDNEGGKFLSSMIGNPNEDLVQGIQAYAVSKGLISKAEATDFQKSHREFGEQLKQTIMSMGQCGINLDAIISETEDINEQDSEGKTLLMQLCEEAVDAESIRKVLNAGADIEIKDMYNWTALMFAARNPNPEVTKKLLASGASVNYLSNDGRDALTVAISNYNTEIVKILLDAGADAIFSRATDGTPLGLAGQVGCGVEIIDLIAEAISRTESVEQHAKNAIDRYFHSTDHGHDKKNLKKLIELSGVISAEYYTELLLKIVYCADVESVRELIGLGADVNARTELGKTVLMEAADNRDPKVVREFLRHGVYVDAVTVFSDKYRGKKFNSVKEGYTALHYALWKNDNIEIAEVLVKAGADIKNEELYGDLAKVAMRNDNKDAVIFAGELGFDDVTGKDSSYADSAILIDVADNCDFQNAQRLLKGYRFSQDGLDRAVIATCESCIDGRIGKKSLKNEILKLLFAKGASIEAKNAYGYTPLMIRAMKGFKSAEVLEFLIDNGADINAKINKGKYLGKTPLLCAANGLNVVQIKILLEAGADVNVVDGKGRGLLAESISRGNVECLRLLINADAKIDISKSYDLLRSLISKPAEKRDGLLALYLKAGLDINYLQPMFDKTVLMKVCQFGRSPEEVQFLLDLGVDVTIKNKKGRDAKYYIQKNRHLKEFDLF